MSDTHTTFRRLYVLTVSILIVNFFLTSNPYAASHSGRIGATGVDDKHFLAPAYLILIGLTAVAVMYQRVLLLDYRVITAILVMLVSGLASSTIASEAVTYTYNALAFILCSSVAIVMGGTSLDVSIEETKALLRFLNLLLIAGVILALAYPGRYGSLPFEFSRLSSRGEVTLWNYTAITVVYSSFAIAAYHKFRLIHPLIISLLAFIVILSTYTRTPLLIMSLPFIIYVLFLSKPIIRVSAVLLGVTGCVLFSREVAKFFLVTDGGDATSGRLQLWEYHWNYFLKNPLLGNGAYFQSTLGNYSGDATSEIGILKMYSEFGLLFGAIMTYLIVKAVINGLRVLRNVGQAHFMDLFLALTLISMVPNLVQTYSRILSMEDMVFWLSVFYLSAKSKPLIRYVILGKPRGAVKAWQQQQLRRVSV